LKCTIVHVSQYIYTVLFHEPMSDALSKAWLYKIRLLVIFCAAIQLFNLMICDACWPISGSLLKTYGAINVLLTNLRITGSLLAILKQDTEMTYEA